MSYFNTDRVRDFENSEARLLDRVDRIEREARFAPVNIVAGDMIRCPKCGTWHYRNDPCPN